MNLFILSQANYILFTNDNHVTDHVSVYRTRSSTINKPPSECIFITWSGKNVQKKKKNSVALFVKYIKNSAN